MRKVNQYAKSCRSCERPRLTKQTGVGWDRLSGPYWASWPPILTPKQRSNSPTHSCLQLANQATNPGPSLSVSGPAKPSPESRGRAASESPPRLGRRGRRLAPFTAINLAVTVPTRHSGRKTRVDCDTGVGVVHVIRPGFQRVDRFFSLFLDSWRRDQNFSPSKFQWTKNNLCSERFIRRVRWWVLVLV